MPVQNIKLKKRQNGDGFVSGYCQTGILARSYTQLQLTFENGRRTRLRSAVFTGRRVAGRFQCFSAFREARRKCQGFPVRLFGSTVGLADDNSVLQQQRVIGLDAPNTSLLVLDAEIVQFFAVVLLPYFERDLDGLRRWVDARHNGGLLLSVKQNISR